jgi:hypothetical protein
MMYINESGGPIKSGFEDFVGCDLPVQMATIFSCMKFL